MRRATGAAPQLRSTPYGSPSARLSRRVPSPSPNVATDIYGNEFGRFIKQGNTREAVQAFTRITAPTQRESTLAFHAANAAKDINLMEKLWPRMSPKSWGPATTSLMSRYADTGNVKRMMELLRAAGTRASIYDYTTAVGGLGQARQFKEMEELMNEALKRSKPTVAIYTTAMNCYIKANKFKEALAVADRMRAANMRPDELAYTTLFNLCAKTGRLGDAQRLQAEMEGRGMKMTISHFHSLMYASVTAGRLDEATRWLETIKQQRSGNDIMATYEVLMNALLTQWKRTFNGALLNKIAEVFDKVTAEKDAVPSKLLLTTAMSASAKRGDNKRAGVIISLYDKHYKRDPVFLHTMLELYVRAKEEDEAQTIFDEMKSSKNVSSAAYKLMVGLYADVGKLDAAVQTFEEAKKEQRLEAGLYREIIAACERCKSPTLAEKYTIEEKAALFQ